MKKAFLTALLMLAVVSVTAQESDYQRTITVTGNAQIDVEPDKVIITFGVETQGENLRTAKSENDAIVKNLLSALKGAGINERDIQTNYINIEPRYDYYDTQAFYGFFARKTVVATLEDVSKLDAVLSLALEAGVNYIHGIDFQTSRLLELRNKARRDAIRAAREKAEMIASELGCQVGNPIYVYENQSSYWTWGGAAWGMSWASNSQNYAYYGNDVTGGESPISPGQVSVYASVSVSFELK
ncbi:SIMPL domain-containing protein [candidate division WOR-3 bacterium]|nr:SIMPL domain-containing protein [candidate division WOR-3 bacterium]